MVKRIYRSSTDKMVGGVCGGLGEYFEIDPTIIRIIWLVCVFVAGGGLFAYLLALIIIPSDRNRYITG